MRRIIFTTLGTVAVCAALVAAGQAPPRQPAQPTTKKPSSTSKPAPPKPAAQKPASIMAVAHEGALLTSAEQTAMVKQYCAGCHSDRAKAGGLSLASFNAADAAVQVETTEKMIRKLRAGMMPPAGAKRPDGNALIELASALEQRVDRAAALNPNPGFRPFQRANRAEYGRAVRDLLGIDVDVNAFLPPDTISNGFDNVADSQTLSPTLMEGYLRAASQISRLALGDRNATATSVTFKIPRAK